MSDPVSLVIATLQSGLLSNRYETVGRANHIKLTHESAVISCYNQLFKNVYISVCYIKTKEFKYATMCLPKHNERYLIESK